MASNETVTAIDAIPYNGTVIDSVSTSKTLTVNENDGASKKRRAMKSDGIIRKRVNLSVSKKLEIIHKLESGLSAARVCDEYGIKKQTVSNIRKAKDKLRAFALKYDVDSFQPGSLLSARKHMRSGLDANFEDAVYKWYVQERLSGANVRSGELRRAASTIAKNMNIENFHASDGWLWRFRNRHGLSTRVATEEPVNGPATDIEKFYYKLNNVIKLENLCLSQIYNSDETPILWRALPKNTMAFSFKLAYGNVQERLSTLCCANADGTHRLKLAVVGQTVCPRILKDCLQELPVIYYHAKKNEFTGEIFCNWFHKHFVPEVRKYQVEVLKFDPKDVKALLLLDNAPVHPCLKKLISDDGKIKVMFLPLDNSSLLQPMEQGVVLAFKRLYLRRYLKEVLVVVEDEADAANESRDQRTIQNIKNYNIKSALYNFAASWNEVKVATLSNSWKKLLQNIEIEYDFMGIQVNDFHQTLMAAGEQNVTLEDVETWLDDNDGDPDFQVMNPDVSVEILLGNNVSGNEEEIPRKKPKMSEVREWIDNLLHFVDTSSDKEVQPYYEHLRSLREVIISKQYQNKT